MTSFLDTLEKSNEEQQGLNWRGTFKEFLQIFESGKFPNLAISAHERVEKMILNAGTQQSDFFGQKRIRYNFFEDSLLGIEQTVDNVMSYIHAAARRTETSRRMLLLYGPPSSGKSQMVAMIKRGLEKFSMTDEGAIFAIEGSKMYENPFLLVPDHLRNDFEKHYKIKIDGKLNPLSQLRLRTEFNNKFMDFPIERIFLSETERVGIGTWLPSDGKSQDSAELIGSIDFSKIQDYGNESDPRCYSFDGELNVSNRGVMEFIEGLKADEKFLRLLLVATQEKAIKAPRFGLISVDSCIVMHTNETEFKNFMNEKKYEAYHDRMFIIKAPYNLGVTNEVKIYQDLLSKSDLSNIHIAPHSLYSAAMFAVLTRLDIPKDGDLTIVKKMKLYDGQDVKGMKTEQVLDMKKKNPHEGMNGCSSRFIIDQINTTISKAIEEKRNFVTALDILRQLSTGITMRDAFSPDEKNKYKELIDVARQELNEKIRNDIQKAFFLSFDKEASDMCAKYLDQVEASLSGTKPRDPVSGEEIDIDENLMESIENNINISHSGREDFRNEILRYFGVAARHGKKVDYSQHAALREAIQKQLFNERQGVIRMTVSSRNPDPEAVRRLNEVIDRMVTQQGYTAASANEMLKYATAHLFEKK